MMNLYFSSAYPCAIKQNGVFSATVSDSPTNIVANENVFIEACPIACKEQTVNFFPTTSFFCSPPSNVIITDLCGGYLIRFKSTAAESGFNVLGQIKNGEFVATLFNENGIKLSLETPYDFFAEEIHFNAAEITAEKKRLFNKDFIIVELIGEKKILSVFNVSDKITKIFEREISSFSTNDCFTTTEKFIDMARHEVTISWEYKNDKFIEESRSIKAKEGFYYDTLANRLLPYAFSEEFLVGGDYTVYLSENVKNNSDKLNGYFGNYIGVMPPPFFRNEQEVGFIYKKTDNTFYVKYFVFELKNRKIVNIKHID